MKDDENVNKPSYTTATESTANANHHCAQNPQRRDARVHSEFETRSIDHRSGRRWGHRTDEAETAAGGDAEDADTRDDDDDDDDDVDEGEEAEARPRSCIASSHGRSTWSPNGGGGAAWPPVS